MTDTLIVISVPPRDEDGPDAKASWYVWDRVRRTNVGGEYRSAREAAAALARLRRAKGEGSR